VIKIVIIDGGSCDSSFQIDCECKEYNTYDIRPGYEQEIIRLCQEESGPKKKFDKLEREVKNVKTETQSRLKDVA
jgi:hypothetical protein